MGLARTPDSSIPLYLMGVKSSFKPFYDGNFFYYRQVFKGLFRDIMNKGLKMDRKNAEQIRRFIYDGLRKTNYRYGGSATKKDRPRELKIDSFSVLRTVAEYSPGQVTTSVLYGSKRDHGECIAYLKRESGANLYEKSDGSKRGGKNIGELALERRRAVEGIKKDAYILGANGCGEVDAVEDKNGSKALVERLSKKLTRIAFKSLGEILAEEERMRGGKSL